MSLSELCTQCGLCCDGSMFQYVTVRADPPSPLLEKVTMSNEGERRIMALPCGALKNRCCSEYESRPENCRRFVCDLGLKVRDEGLPVEEATPIVVEALRLVGLVREALPPPPGRGAMIHAQMVLADASMPLETDALRKIRAADRYLKEHFLP